MPVWPTQIMVVGTDGIPDAFTSVAEGRMAATVAQDPAHKSAWFASICSSKLFKLVTLAPWMQNLPSSSLIPS